MAVAGTLLRIMWVKRRFSRGRTTCDRRAGSGRMPPRLCERPFRPAPGGILWEFPRGLGQFPSSFPAQARRVPARPATVASVFRRPPHGTK